ncbi:DUF1349 domain-containing protein [Pseudomonas oryzihabitans]|uniref:DUF1349 domain-containing protein n=1 Tax=Pseudomonas oryzihabitans TaxID=47885 RepID=UPI00289407C4|nr:DUF1349 domain-containing protein [Pseudomonas oryzihabitans]MDT3722244.1 DUF1349 domain-containing protein [Pseudomonas oryzihabitans]
MESANAPSPQWLNEPQRWSESYGSLHVRTEAGSDFWQKTQYGFARDNGHFLGHPVAADFTAQVRITGTFTALYDQAGLMVRLSSERWCKSGLEINDGIAHLGSVLTLGHSDWALGAVPDALHGFWLRLTLQAEVLRIQYSLDGQVWPLLRLCRFAKGEGGAPQVGPYCCSPEREGLEVTFADLRIGPALGKDLHDLS